MPPVAASVFGPGSATSPSPSSTSSSASSLFLLSFLSSTGIAPRRAASRYAAFDSGLDPDDLQAARQWRQALVQETLPKGSTTYSRSSGPGGQHVNKTETKATTSWPVGELAGTMPALLRAGLRTSRYYTKTTDSLTIQAQTQRSRTANTEANRQKLFEELVALYETTVPGEARPETATKYKAV